MCLIAVAPKGTDKYSEFFLNAIRKASISNTDGIGYSFKRASNKNKVWISKGFKDIDRFIDLLKSKKLKSSDELVVHLRIGNKGAKTAAMCHPFVVSNKPDEILINNQYVSMNTICHNGTFFDYSINDSQFSDTFFFTKDFLSVPELDTLIRRDKDIFAKTFKNILKTNRVAIIFSGNSPMITLGEFFSDGPEESQKKYLFSNESYKRDRYSNVGGNEIFWDRLDRQRRYIDDEVDDNDEVDTRRNLPAPISHNCHISNIRQKVMVDLENKSKVGERKRNRAGLLIADSKFDIIPPIGGNAVTDSSLNILLYEMFGGGIYVPIQYTSTQETAIKFVPRIWNFKHFTFLCSVGDNVKGYRRNVVYEMRTFDINSRMHEIWPSDNSQRNIRDCIYVTTLDLIRNFFIFYKEKYSAYIGVYRLIRKFNNPSKNLFNLAEKVINKAIKAKKSNDIVFKDIKGLELQSLQIYQNYMGEFLYDKNKAADLRNRVQPVDVWVN